MSNESFGVVLTNRSAEDRSETDFYPTPPLVTKALIDFLQIPKGNHIWECACGEGDMAQILIDAGYYVHSTDLHNTGFGQSGIDFLKTEFDFCDWIITNPPFKYSEAFIEKCIKSGKPFALLLKSQYWHASKRTKLFQKHKPKYILPLSWRPDFNFKKRELGLLDKKAAPPMECLWVVWDSTPSEFAIYEILEKPISDK